MANKAANKAMNQDVFAELIESVREGGRIRRGQQAAARENVIEDVDVAALRESLGYSQVDFAILLRMSVDTIQNYEQGRRKPKGAARALLKIVREIPDEAIRALHA